MNLVGKTIEDIKMQAQQKCYQIKAKGAFLMKYGNDTYKLLYKEPVEGDKKKIVATYKWIEGEGLKIKENGKERTLPQKLSDVATKKTGKPSK